MRSLAYAALFSMLSLSACGGGGGGGISTNAFTGTLNIAAGTASATCVATHAVAVSATGTTPNVVAAAVGDCLGFTNVGAGAHEIAAREATGCSVLDGPRLSGDGQVFTTAPIPASDAGKVCHWQDLENPPPAGGGGY